MSLKIISDVQAFTVFKELEKDKVIQNFYRLLRKEDLESYATFVSSLYEQNTDNWTRYLVSKVLSLENCLVSMACSQKSIPYSIREAASFELDILEEMSWKLQQWNVSVPAQMAGVAALEKPK